MGPDEAYYCVNAQGTLTFEAVAEAGALASKLPGYRPGMNALWDLREADLTGLDRKALERLSEVIRQHPARLGAKIAIVVVRDVDYGIMRMWQVYGEDAPQNRRVFAKITDAQAWLRESV